MKKLLLILLCLPMIGFGQTTWTPCDSSFSININSQNSIEVVYSVSGPNLNVNSNPSWVYFNMLGSCIGGSSYNSQTDTVNINNNLPDSTAIMCLITDSLSSCIVTDTLVLDSLSGWFFTSNQSLGSQCNSNPYLVSGWGGTLLLSDSSSISTGLSTNYSVSYLWDFGDGFISNQQNPCHTYGDISTLPNPWYVTLTVTYFDSITSLNVCQDTDSIDILFFINPCVYGDLQISALGSNLTANQSYSSSITACPNVYPNSFLWSNGDTNQTINVSGPGLYSCTVTSNVGCVYTESYNYYGTLTPTFDCTQMDIFEANNNFNVLSFQSSYLNNNYFPELIDSLSYWEAYTPDGNICGFYPMNGNFSFQNFGLGGSPSDSMNICFYVYLYDNYFQHDLSVSPQQGSLCSSCDLFFWDGSNWVTQLISTTYDCDLVNGCYDPGTGLGTYTSLSACQSNCVIPTTYDCDLVSGCYDPGTGLGTYASLSACQNNCVIPATYDCDLVSGCYDPGTGFGTYASLSACQSICFVSLTNEFSGIISRKLMKIVDVYAREINTIKENQTLFYIYDDGTVEKKIFLE